MRIKPLIKVPLVLIENVFFTLFPKSRPLIEKFFYNPYQFNEDHIAYSKKQYASFLDKIGGRNAIKDKVILELGPGGSIGFGLLILKGGASKYYAIDDGVHAFITKKQMQGYLKLLRNENNLIDRYFSRKGVNYVYKESKIKIINIDQDSKYLLPENTVDFIYSCAVLEHVHNLDNSFSEMTRVLKHGGIMNHQVDLRDHIFSQDSLWFLNMSDFWFKALFSKTGEYVNRKRFSFYEDMAKKYGLEIINIEKKHFFEKEISSKLTEKFSDSDLRTLSFNITLKKK